MCFLFSSTNNVHTTHHPKPLFYPPNLSCLCRQRTRPANFSLLLRSFYHIYTKMPTIDEPLTVVQMAINGLKVRNASPWRSVGDLGTSNESAEELAPWPMALLMPTALEPTTLETTSSQRARWPWLHHIFCQRQQRLVFGYLASSFYWRLNFIRIQHCQQHTPIVSILPISLSHSQSFSHSC